MQTQLTTDAADEARTQFRRGFLSLLPLWAGAIPVGIVFGVAARNAGLGGAETQLMSLIVFSAAAQLNAVSQVAAGSSTLLLVGTALALNAQLLLIGLSAGRQVRLPWFKRLIPAWFLTDGAYGIASAEGRIRLPVLLGAGVSMYVGWNLGTTIGIFAGEGIPDPRRWGIDLVAPLTFLAVLVPSLKTNPARLVAAVAGVSGVALSRFLPAGLAVLTAGFIGSSVGAWRSGPVRKVAVQHPFESTANG